jgi:hypothetical protein
MAAIRETGKINDNTSLIDVGMMGVSGVLALYLIEDERTCLIDGGTRTEAKRIINTLRAMNAFPPGYRQRADSSGSGSKSATTAPCGRCRRRRDG